MANTEGIAALLKALNESPGLGSGLKPNSVGQTARAARAKGPATDNFATGLSGSTMRPIRAAASGKTGPAMPLPKILGPEGQNLDPKAPRGTYLNVVV